MSAVSQVIPLAPLLYRHLQRAQTHWATRITGTSYNGNEQLEGEDIDQTGDRHDNHIRPLHQVTESNQWEPKDKRLLVDQGEEQKCHINCIELLAAMLALRKFAKNSTGVGRFSYA